jgi:hypothetical protein
MLRACGYRTRNFCKAWTFPPTNTVRPPPDHLSQSRPPAASTHYNGARGGSAERGRTGDHRTPWSRWLLTHTQWRTTPERYPTTGYPILDSAKLMLDIDYIRKVASLHTQTPLPCAFRRSTASVEMIEVDEPASSVDDVSLSSRRVPLVKETREAPVDENALAVLLAIRAYHIIGRAHDERLDAR